MQVFNLMSPSVVAVWSLTPSPAGIPSVDEYRPRSWEDLRPTSCINGAAHLCAWIAVVECHLAEVYSPKAA
jgi:hypothetical protein